MEITVKHQNPDLGDLDQKLSDQQCRIFGQKGPGWKFHCMAQNGPGPMGGAFKG